MSGEDTRPRRNRPHPVIRASEIGAYVYCRRAWWLRRVAGFEPQDREEAFARGIAAHARHGRTVRRGQWLRRAALALLLAGIILLLLALILIALG